MHRPTQWKETHPQRHLLGLPVVASGFSCGPTFGCGSGPDPAVMPSPRSGSRRLTLLRRPDFWLRKHHLSRRAPSRPGRAVRPPRCHYRFQRCIQHHLSTDVKPLKLSLWSTREDGFHGRRYYCYFSHLNFVASTRCSDKSLFALTRNNLTIEGKKTVRFYLF